MIDVDWKTLANQLELQHKATSIEIACSDGKNSDKLVCYVRELVAEFIQSQPSEPCIITVGKIAVALDKLGITKIADDLCEKFGMIIRLL